MVQPTPEQAAILEKRFPMPKREDYEDQEGYEEALAGARRRWQQALQFAPSTGSPPPSK